jgi:hypothetical protein
MRIETVAATMIVIIATFIGFVAVTKSEAKPSDNCECQELRAIRRILEQQFQVVCDERRCLPVPTPTASTGGPLE